MKVVRKLSPWGYVRKKDLFVQGRKQISCEMAGIAVIDYLDLYRKFTYKAQESYRLDHIANVELGKKKLDHSEFDTFRDFYTGNWQKFIEYNIIDVELVDQLEDKMKLIELCLTMAYDAKVNYMDVLGQVKYWDVLIFNYLRDRNIVIPQKKKSDKSEKFEGAYVKEPQVGMHKWVMSFDLNSLYPHLIMQYNISPETVNKDKRQIQKMTVDKLLSKDTDMSEVRQRQLTMTPNGALFKTTKRGFLPELMETIYNDRVQYKKLMLQSKQQYENTKDPKLLKDISKYNNIQMAKKISLNSAYGAIGNEWFRYYDLLIAEGITTAGQLSIRWIENKINQYMNKLLDTKDKDYVIASDTDSIYVTFEGLIEKYKPKNPVDFLDIVAKEKIEPYIDKSYQELANYTNAYAQKMQMKREVIADKGIWTAKKRYILNAHDVEGVRYKEPQLKIMGIEAVKSSTPAPCRQKIKDALKIIMSGDEKELNNFIKKFRDDFMNLPPEDIAYPRSVNGISKYTDNSSGHDVAINLLDMKQQVVKYNLFKSRSPIHVRGAILYNHLVEKHKLNNKLVYIQEGDKIKFLHMKQPNIYQSSSISFVTELPKDLGLHELVDRELQFEKSFIEPLKFITDKVLWRVDESYGQQGSLEDFM